MRSASTETECPTCGRDDFASVQGMKSHHAQAHGESIKGVEYECDWCGTTERRCPSQLEGNEHNFCGQDCQGEYMSEHIRGEVHWNYVRVDVECDWCGTVESRRPSDANEYERNFCGSDCQGEYISEHLVGESSPNWEGARVEFECTWCGKDDTASRYRASRMTNLFCSRKCRGSWQTENLVGENSPWWKGGQPEYYGPNWDSIATSIRERDEHTCQYCDTQAEERKHDVHHIIPLRLFKRWDVPLEDAHVPRNLVTLCRSCHKPVEAEHLETPYPDSHWRAE